MSKWSGKCDFCDTLEIYGVTQESFEDFKNSTKLYIWDNDTEKEVVLSEYSDLIPYFTHLVSTMYCSDGVRIIHLTSKSWLETDNYCPSEYRLEMMHEFEDFVRENGKEPLWDIPTEERDKWTKCPLGRGYFCEFKEYQTGYNGKRNHICPFMYSRKQKNGEICKIRNYNLKKAQNKDLI